MLRPSVFSTRAARILPWALPPLEDPVSLDTSYTFRAWLGAYSFEGLYKFKTKFQPPRWTPAWTSLSKTTWSASGDW